MEDVLLSLHVLAAIVFIGGSAVATSLFPRYAPLAATAPTEAATVPVGAATVPAEAAAAPAGAAPGPDGRAPAVAAALHRVTRGYAVAGLIVPAAGLVLAAVQGRMGEVWIILSMILAAGAAGLLATQIVPRQRVALGTPGPAAPLRTLSMLSGLYNLLWTIVVIMMIVRPGAEG
ncbi:hypothetical protein ACFOWE_00225 [Planomonospora corallina]|uniref:Integral membrane protein n=1 Tax=Planomonospora corallina TaxID=1806052 RepID=A0ABV8HXN9_9ACTN